MCFLRVEWLTWKLHEYTRIWSDENVCESEYVHAKTFTYFLFIAKHHNSVWICILLFAMLFFPSPTLASKLFHLKLRLALNGLFLRRTVFGFLSLCKIFTCDCAACISRNMFFPCIFFSGYFHFFCCEFHVTVLRTAYVAYIINIAKCFMIASSFWNFLLVRLRLLSCFLLSAL